MILLEDVNSVSVLRSCLENFSQYIKNSIKIIPFTINAVDSLNIEILNFEKRLEYTVSYLITVNK